MELSFYGTDKTRGQYYKTLAIVRRKGDDFASELKEQKGRAIWLTGSARELLITSHVIELRSSRGNHHADAMRSARLDAHLDNAQPAYTIPGSRRCAGSKTAAPPPDAVKRRYPAVTWPILRTEVSYANGAHLNLSSFARRMQSGLCVTATTAPQLPAPGGNRWRGLCFCRSSTRRRWIFSSLD